MSPHSPAHHTGETQTSPESYEQAFKDAQATFYALPFNENFNALCVDRHIHPGDSGKSEYWRAVADFGFRSYLDQRKAGIRAHETIAQALLTATPDFIYTQAALQRHTDAKRHGGTQTGGNYTFASAENFHEAKRRVSSYNRLLRATVDEWPDMRPSRLNKSLLNIANISIENPVLLASSAGTIRDHIFGLQHELVYEQILAHTGRSYRKSTIEEDMAGVDYFVSQDDGTEEGIDVKSSQTAIWRRGAWNTPYIHENGRLVMSPLVRHQQIGDHFHIPETLAQEKAILLNNYLDEAFSPQERVAYSS